MKKFCIIVPIISLMALTGCSNVKNTPIPEVKSNVESKDSLNIDASKEARKKLDELDIDSKLDKINNTSNIDTNKVNEANNKLNNINKKLDSVSNDKDEAINKIKDMDLKISKARKSINNLENKVNEINKKIS